MRFFRIFPALIAAATAIVIVGCTFAQQPYFQPQTGGFHGDTRYSNNAEARSMSPPEWGEEPTPLSNPGLTNSPSLPLINQGPAGILPHSIPSQANLSSASTDQSKLKKANSSVYQPVIDPAKIFRDPYQDQGNAPQTQSSGFYRPQSFEEKGYRTEGRINRGIPFDHGEAFDFETKKKQYPPMREILATGRYFAMTEYWLAKPYFNNNSVLSTQSSTFMESFQADHAFESAPRFRFGFESKFGPGAELQYFQFDHNSRPIEFTSTAGVSAQSSVDVVGVASPAILATTGSGQRMRLDQSLEVHSLMFVVFKEVKMPISRVNGMLGTRYASIAQSLQAQLLDAGGNSLGFLNHSTDFRGYGPYFSIEYYRPVGHTKLELFGSAAGSLMLGNRDQFVNQSNVFQSRRVGADEMVTTFDVTTGLQYKKETAENRSYYARLAYLNQVWLNGGTPNSPHDDFGFRGIGFAVGLNR